MEFTREQRRISRHFHVLACLHFFGTQRVKSGWVLHHKDETLMMRDPERYIQWRIEELVPMTISEHVSHHKVGNKYFQGHKHTAETIEKMKQAKSQISEETRQKQREARLGKKLSQETKFKISQANIGNKKHLGKKCSEKSRQRMREAHLGKALADETKQKLSVVRKGLKFWNNGEINVRARECPEGFVAGRLKKS